MDEPNPKNPGPQTIDVELSAPIKPARLQADRLYRVLVETVRDYAIFHLDPKGYISSWNAGARRLKGYEKNEILGQHFSVFYPPEDIASGKPEHELVVAEAEGRF